MDTSLMIPLFHHWNLDASQPSGSRDPAPPLLSSAQARLSFGSGLLTLFTRRAAVKTHLTRNRQLLTRGPKGVPPLKDLNFEINGHAGEFWLRRASDGNGQLLSPKGPGLILWYHMCRLKGRTWIYIPQA